MKISLFLLYSISPFRMQKVSGSKTGEQLYHNSFITNHQMTPEEVAAVAHAGRGRWKGDSSEELLWFKFVPVRLEASWAFSECFWMKDYLFLWRFILSYRSQKVSGSECQYNLSLNGAENNSSRYQSLRFGLAAILNCRCLPLIDIVFSIPATLCSH